MSKRFSLLLTSFMLAIFVGLVSVSFAADEPAGAPEKKSEAKDSSKEVVVRGKLRLKVKAEKPEPDLTFDVDEIAVPYVKTEDSVLDVSPTSMAQPAVSVPSFLNSEQAASPHIQMFQRPPILTLNPKYNSRVSIAKWRLRITDGFGNVFRDFAGKGNLPKKIVWDGLSKDKKTMVDVGTSYSYIFSIIDVASNPTSQMGKPIVLESLMYEKNNVVIAKVVSEALYGKKGRRTILGEKGKLYISEIADLMIAYKKFPLIIESYGKDVDDASYKGELIQKYLAKRLTLPKKNFKVLARKSRLPKIVFKVRK